MVRRERRKRNDKPQPFKEKAIAAHWPLLAVFGEHHRTGHKGGPECKVWVSPVVRRRATKLQPAGWILITWLQSSARATTLEGSDESNEQEPSSCIGCRAGRCCCGRRERAAIGRAPGPAAAAVRVLDLTRGVYRRRRPQVQDQARRAGNQGRKRQRPFAHARGEVHGAARIALSVAQPCRSRGRQRDPGRAGLRRR